jgi:imidazolonepropionase-like amidohydrolase
MEKDLGRVASVFLADLIAVDGDPLQKIDVLFTNVRWVMREGRVLIDR